MALWKRAGTYNLDITAPDGTRIRRSTGTSDREKAKEYHDRLKAELWDLARLKRKPPRSWDETALRWLKEKAHKKSYRDDVQRIRWFTGHLSSTLYVFGQVQVQKTLLFTMWSRA